MIGIFAGSSYSFLGGQGLDVKDTYLHFAEYLGLGVLTARMVDSGKEHSRLGSTLLALGIVAVYGGLDEVHQAWVPGRAPDLGDLGYDIVGGLAGVIAYAILSRRVYGSRQESEEPG
jgi:VanZ family protein